MCVQGSIWDVLLTSEKLRRPREKFGILMLPPRSNTFVGRHYIIFSLPRKSELNRRHILNSADCERCGSDMETPIHAIMLCEKINGSWNASDKGSDGNSEPSNKMVLINSEFLSVGWRGNNRDHS